MALDPAFPLFCPSSRTPSGGLLFREEVLFLTFLLVAVRVREVSSCTQRCSVFYSLVYPDPAIDLLSDSLRLFSVRISAYTNQSRVSHSVRMRENSAEEYPKQSSLERSF